MVAPSRTRAVTYVTRAQAVTYVTRVTDARDVTPMPGLALIQLTVTHEEKVENRLHLRDLPKWQLGFVLWRAKVGQWSANPALVSRWGYELSGKLPVSLNGTQKWSLKRPRFGPKSGLIFASKRCKMGTKWGQNAAEWAQNAAEIVASFVAGERPLEAL